MLTVGENTNLHKFIRYIEPAVKAGNRKYWVWKSGPVPDRLGAWAENAPVPNVDNVEQLFCAAVPNLALRRVGKRIPFRLNAQGNETIDGGVAAYFDGVLGNGYYHTFTAHLNYKRARKWARETRSGVLVGWPFRGSALLDQGHVGILLPSGFVLQCFSDPNGPDLNWNYTIEQFGHGVRHALMVHPKNWIEYEGDLADWAKEEREKEEREKGKKGKPEHKPH
jgi:hypothetical protein